LSREDVKMLVDSLKETQPTVVEELTPAQATFGEIQRVLQGLLRERVAIRDLARIFEAMSASIRAGNQTTEGMVEAAREVLGSAITTNVAMDGVLHVITLEPTFEQNLLAAARSGQDGQTLAIDAAVLIRMSADIGALFTQAEESGISPVLVCAGQLRAPLYRQLRHEFPRLPVVAYSELGGSVDIQTVGTVGNEPANVA